MNLKLGGNSAGKWWMTALAAGGALAVAGMAFAAGIPQVQLTVARQNHDTGFLVTGALPHSSIEVLKLHVDGKRTIADLVKTRTMAVVGGPQLTLGVAGGKVAPGVYIAVEVVGRTVKTSAPFAWKVPLPNYAVKLTPVKELASPSVPLRGGLVRADNGPGTTNGPSCGNVAFTEVGGSWIGTWTGCSSLSAYAGDSVLVYGMAPYNGGSPGDNPETIEGIWVGDASNGGAVTDTGTAQVNIGSTNTVGSYNGLPFTPGEYFNMELMSSAVESPDGQLPEVPIAVALPLLLAVPAALLMLRKRGGQIG